jgi:hypothetical protein
MKLRIALAAAASGLAAASAAMAGPVTATAPATATIVAPGQMTNTRSLDFGTVAKPSTGTTTVTVASAASDTATPGVSGGNGYVPTSGLAHAATFHLVGSTGQQYSVTANGLSFTNAAGNLTSVGSESPVAASGTINTLTTGADDLYVGGHFDITPATAATSYNGTLSLTVNFN